jgi:hypothetical protein
MSDMETVKARYPDAIAFKWTGYWRVYKTPKIMTGGAVNLISDAYSSEDEAWASARASLETVKPEDIHEEK